MRRLTTILPALLLLCIGTNITINAQEVMKPVPQNISAFPVGDKNPEQNAKYFIGQSYLAPLTKLKELNCPIYNVTFEPGCRNNWHKHTGGQILIAVGGRGYYQEKGQPARLLLPGDVVEIAPEVVHWHGAAPDSWFSHLAIECNPQTNHNTWLDPVDDAQYREATGQTACRLSDEARRNLSTWLPADTGTLPQTDPELAEVFGNFAFGEVMSHGKLDLRTRILVTMASTIAQNTPDEYRRTLQAALANGISPVEMREVLYQSVAYVGMARVSTLLGVFNDFLAQHGIDTPLPPQSATSPQDRMEKGLELQKDIFGAEAIDKMYASAPENQLHIQHYLSANCFGDYQTRTGLDKQMRELITFSILVSLGGCEPQVKGHIAGNLLVGNDKQVLLDTVTQLLPYIGYPRTLNAIACLNEVVPEHK